MKEGFVERGKDGEGGDMMMMKLEGEVWKDGGI